MKKVLSLVIVIAMMLAVVPIVNAQGGDEYYLGIANGEWDFKFYDNMSRVPEDITSIVFEDKIQVPGAMELQGYGYPSYYYEEMGGWGQPEDDGVRTVGVYKKVFAPLPTSERFSWVYFSSVRGNMTVYLNGEKIGESRNGAVGSYFQAQSNSGEENTLICVVERDNSGINKSDDFSLSGIMGDVYFGSASSMYEGVNSKDVKVEGNRLVIDGEEVVLKGVKYTATHPETGNSLTNAQIDKDLTLIKEYGFNTIWTSCAPEYFYSKAESMGLYVIDEANVNLSYADRDMENAKIRVSEMIMRHHEYKSIIMWSVGFGEGNTRQLTDVAKKLDSRPVAQEVTFAEDFKVFGNTGDMEDWVNSLGEGNVGGFVEEFADKELYFTRNVYLFDTVDSVTGETVSVEGEIKNYMGTQMLGRAGYVRNVDNMDKFTVLTYISNANKNRVIFESEDKNIRLETVDYRIRLTVNGRSIDADGGEGKVAAVYADGEMQLFTSRSFKGNMECDARLTNSYKVGEGDGNVAIEYVKIYNDALTLDELVEMSAEEKCVSSVEFKNINIKEDKSYDFLAYGGDFGDVPNSYYKCLTGIFTSTREPHPEAKAFKEAFSDQDGMPEVEGYFATGEKNLAPLEKGENAVIWNVQGNKYEVSYDGKILNIEQNGKKQISEPMYPSILRENTLSEYEMGTNNYERWKKGRAEIKDNVLYVELISEVTEGKISLAYSVDTNGIMYVSTQASFADGAQSPTFVGFKGVSDYNTVTWTGSETSNYPDRRYSDMDQYTKSVKDMGDNYAVPQENGNRLAYMMVLHDDKTDLNKEGEGLMFIGIDSPLEMQVLDYSSESMARTDHDEDLLHENKAYFRVGGYISGVGNSREYKLTENYYGFDMIITTGAVKGQPVVDVQKVSIGDERFKAFTAGVETYVYRTNESVEVNVEGEKVQQDEEKAVFGKYEIYFAPDTEYMSDMIPSEITAEIAKDVDFNGAGFTIRGNDYWAPPASYDKGITLKNGSVTYDVSNMNNHVFNAVIGKNDFDWRKMGGGFDRNMFNASCNVTITLDGVVVEEIKDISMRGGSREVNIDVSDASVMTITVTGSGRAAQYEDVVLANAAFVPDGPIVVNFEKKDGKATITVLNTDEEQVDVVLTATENNIVTTEATNIGKGLYSTLEVKAGDGAYVKAFVTGIGEIVISN